MQFKPESHIVDTSRMVTADETLVADLKAAGEDTARLSELITGRTHKDVRAACERLLFEDHTRGLQVALIAYVRGSRSLVDFSLKRMQQDPYYGFDERRIAERYARDLYERAETQPKSTPNRAQKRGSA